MIRKAKLGKLGTEIQVAYATSERIKRFHQQRVAFIVLPKTMDWNGPEPSIDGTIKVLKNSSMSHQEWTEDMGLKQWTNHVQWFVRGFYWPYTNSLYFYHGPDPYLYKGCMKYIMVRDNMQALIKEVGGNDHTFIYGGMKSGEPGEHVLFLGHARDLFG